MSLNHGCRLVWHRRDLRLEDNPSYNCVLPQEENCHHTPTTPIIPIVSLYVFDTLDFCPRPSVVAPDHPDWRTIRTGPHAARVLRESVLDLRNSLRQREGELLVRVGKAVDIVPEIAQEVGATEVVWNEEAGTEERDASIRVKEALERASSGRKEIKIITNMTCTLYHPDDLPRSEEIWNRLAHPRQPVKRKRRQEIPTEIPRGAFHQIVDVSPRRLEGMCQIMGDFRRVLRTLKVRSSTHAPSQFILPPIIHQMEAGDLPTLEELFSAARHTPLLGLPENIMENVLQAALQQQDPATCSQAATTDLPNHQDHNSYITRGGETKALQRLQYFLQDDRAASADRSRADVSNDHSSRLGVHLALGTLSPRLVYERAKSHQGAGWLASHLEIRDYFLYLAFYKSADMFRKEGVTAATKKKKESETSVAWRNPSCEMSGSDEIGTTKEEQAQAAEPDWNRWAQGSTGFPLVDAAMKELMATGYCSNRVRQNAASVLTKDLHIDWRAGAEWYQFLLEDHCVAANWVSVFWT